MHCLSDFLNLISTDIFTSHDLVTFFANVFATVFNMLHKYNNFVCLLFRLDRVLTGVPRHWIVRCQIHRVFYPDVTFILELAIIYKQLKPILSRKSNIQLLAHLMHYTSKLQRNDTDWHVSVHAYIRNK